MDKKKIAEIIKRETSGIPLMQDMDLMFAFAKMKAMSMGARGHDKEITEGCLEVIQSAMVKRKLMVETTKLPSGIGMVVNVGKKQPPLKYNSKLIVKSKAKVPKTMLKKVGRVNTLHFHDLMNANDIRIAKDVIETP